MNVEEELLDHLARTFRSMLKAKVDEGARYIEVDFTKLPTFWKFSIPSAVLKVNYVDPAKVNALDVLKESLPGLWGYAEHSGLSQVSICTCCGKEHKK